MLGFFTSIGLGLWHWFDSLFTLFVRLPDGPRPKTVFRHMLYIFQQMGWMTFVLPVCYMGHSLGTMLVPLSLAAIIDTFVIPNDQAWALSSFILLLTIAFIAPLISQFVALTLERFQIGPKIPSMAKRHSHLHLQRQSWSFFQNEFAGRLLTKVNLVRDNTMEMISLLLDNVFWAVTLVVSSFLVLWYLSPWLTLPFLIWLGLICTVGIAILKKAEAVSAQRLKSESLLNGRLSDLYTNALSMMLFTRRDYEDPVIRTAFHERMRIGQRANAWFMLSNLFVAAMNSFLTIGMVWLSYYLWSLDMISPGTIAATLPLVIQLNMQAYFLMHLLVDMGEDSGALQEALDSVAQDPEQVDIPDAPALKVSEGAIRFDQVRFGYSERADMALDGLDFTIAPNEKIALVGASGAGKSTVASVLLRLFDLSSGRILIDGHDIAQVDRDSLREQIGLVTQDTSLLHRSIADNIRYGRMDASDAEVEQAATMAGAMSFIPDLVDQDGNKGMQAMVGERGLKLSGGQRQRISLARIILKDAPIMILDEATSALDSVTEASLQDQLALAGEDKTVITVAHRLSTVRAADRIFVMDKGRIVQVGSHAELAQQPGLYAELWAWQAGKDLD